MQLRRLTQLEKLKLEQERDELRRTIADLNDLLRSENRQRKTVLTELGEIVERYGSKRRTRIVSADDVPVYEAPTPSASAAVPDEPCVMTLSTSGVVGRAPVSGAKRATPGRDDVLVAKPSPTTHGHGLRHHLRGTRPQRARPSTSPTSPRGRAAPTAAQDLRREQRRASAHARRAGRRASRARQRIAAWSSESRPTSSPRPRAGVRSSTSSRQIASLLHSRAPTAVDVVIVTSDGQCLRTAVDGISVQGRAAGGVAGINLRGDAVVVGAGVVIGDTSIVSVTDKGWAKVTEADEIPAKGRGTGGVRLARFPDNQRLTLVYVGAHDRPARGDGGRRQCEPDRSQSRAVSSRGDQTRPRFGAD